ncbi:hypothetical protein QAD02_022784 [Eretmocerus hayati]|uniref:Uncharacterized protein n=1 Tax=Eretmocerus hayati TaxID=131215 RepID=A0ACC2PU93_9HYME|nr:hypothetical protein QAD02_022784 [Eretmocerus hayati]
MAVSTIRSVPLEQWWESQYETVCAQQRSQSTTEIYPDRREKRGSSIHVAHTISESTINKEDVHFKASTHPKKLIESVVKSKRTATTFSPSYETTPYNGERDDSDFTDLPHTKNTRQADSTVILESVTHSTIAPTIPTVDINDNKSKRHTAPQYDQKIDKIQRPPSKSNLKEYTCYCKESECNSKSHCLRDQSYGHRLPVLANSPDREYSDEDDSENDTSAEEFEDLRYAPRHSYLRNMAQITEPSKFNIPFANNVNFDQRVIIRRKNYDSKSNAHPLYRNSMNQALNLHMYDPYGHRYGTFANTFSQIHQGNIIENDPHKDSTSTNPKIHNSYDSKTFDNENCMVLDGRVICRVPSTTKTPVNSVETIDLSNDKVIKNYGYQTTIKPKLPKSEFPKYSSHNGYQTTEATDRNIFANEKGVSNDPELRKDPNFDTAPINEITKAPENKSRPGETQSLSPIRNRDPFNTNQYYPSDTSSHGSNKAALEDIQIPKEFPSQNFHKGMKPASANPQSPISVQKSNATAQTSHSSSSKNSKYPGCVCNAEIGKPTHHGSQSAHQSHSTYNQYAYRYPTQTSSTNTQKYAAYYRIPASGSVSYPTKYDAWGKGKFSRDTSQQSGNTRGPSTYGMKNYAPNYEGFSVMNMARGDETQHKDETRTYSNDCCQNSQRESNNPADSQDSNEIISQSTVIYHASENGLHVSNSEFKPIDSDIQGQSPSKFSLLEHLGVPNQNWHSNISPKSIDPRRNEEITLSSDSSNLGMIEKSRNSKSTENKYGYLEEIYRTRYESPNAQVKDETSTLVTQNPSSALISDGTTQNKVEVKSSTPAISYESLHDPSQQIFWNQKMKDNFLDYVTSYTYAPTYDNFQDESTVSYSSLKLQDIEQTSHNQTLMKDIDDEVRDTAVHTNNLDHSDIYPPQTDFEDSQNEGDSDQMASSQATDSDLHSTTGSSSNDQSETSQKDFLGTNAVQQHSSDSGGIKYRHPKSIYSYASDFGTTIPQQSQGQMNIRSVDYNSAAHQPILSPAYFTSVHSVPINSRTPYKMADYSTYNAPYVYANANFRTIPNQQSLPIRQPLQDYNFGGEIFAQSPSFYDNKPVENKWLEDRQIGSNSRHFYQMYDQIARSNNRGVATGPERTAYEYSPQSNQASFVRSVNKINQDDVVRTDDSETLFKGLEEIILKDHNMTKSSQNLNGKSGYKETFPHGESQESSKNILDEENREKKIQPAKIGHLQNHGNTEITVQSVDDRPSTLFELNHHKQSSHHDVTSIPSSFSRPQLPDDIQNPMNVHQVEQTDVFHRLEDSIGQDNTKAKPGIFLQNVVKKVINNFVPGESQDLIVNYETVPEGVMNTEADLHPKILETPVLRRLFSLPNVENMIVDQASTFYSHLTSSQSDVSPHNVRETFRNIVDQIPPHPTIAPMSAEYSQDHNDQWVTERVTTVMTSLSGTQDSSTKEVFDKIKKIITESALEEEIVKQPVVKNLIIKAVKHALDKERGVIDEHTIRQAFDLLVQPKVRNPVQALDEYGKSNLVPYPEVTTVAPSDFGHKPPPIFTERTLIGDTWVSSVKTLTGLHPNGGSAGYNEERRKALLAKLDELKNQQIPGETDIADDLGSDGRSNTFTTVSSDYASEETPIDDIEDDYDRPIYESDRKPIKYYSPNDRILEYIKNHQVTPDPSFSISTPMTFSFTNEYNDKATTQRANVISTSYTSPTLEGLASTNHYYIVRPPNNNRGISSNRQDVPDTHRDRYGLQHVQDSMPHMQLSNDKRQWNILVEATTRSLESETRTPRNDNFNQLNSQNHRYEMSDRTMGNSYLGRLVPIEYPDPSISNEMRDSDLIWVGDGVRLPLTMRKLTDGTYALTLSDESCQRFQYKECPCCLPTTNNGIVVREKRDGGAAKKKFAGGEMAEYNRKFKKGEPRRDGLINLIAQKIHETSPKENTQKVQFDHEKFLDTINKAYDFAKKVIGVDKLERKDPQRTDDNSGEELHSHPKAETISEIEADKFPAGASNSRTLANYKRKGTGTIDDYLGSNAYSLRRTPYRYQKYAKEDLRVRENINAFKKLLHLIRNAAMGNLDEIYD